MAYPTPEDFVFVEGADPTSLFTGPQATLLLSFLRLTTPNSYRGNVINTTVTPATAGEPSGYPTDWYEWQQRCLWYNPATGELFGYRTGLGWESPTVGDESVTTAKIADGAVTMIKIDPGANLQIIRTNSGGVVEWANLSNILTAGTVPIAAVVTGTGFFRSNGVTNSWGALTAFDINAAIPTGGFAYTKLNQGTSRQLLQMRTDAAAWQVVNPADAFVDGELALTFISPGTGNANKAAVVNAAGTAFEFRALPASTLTVVRTSTATALPAAGAGVTYAHTLGADPTTVEARFYCVVPNNGYVAGDFINHYEVTTGGANDERPAFILRANATNLVLGQANIGGSTQRNFLHATSYTGIPFVEAEWNLVFKATLTA